MEEGGREGPGWRTTESLHPGGERDVQVSSPKPSPSALPCNPHLCPPLTRGSRRDTWEVLAQGGPCMEVPKHRAQVFLRTGLPGGWRAMPLPVASSRVSCVLFLRQAWCREVWGVGGGRWSLRHCQGLGLTDWSLPGFRCEARLLNETTVCFLI